MNTIGLLKKLKTIVIDFFIAILYLYTYTQIRFKPFPVLQVLGFYFIIIIYIFVRYKDFKSLMMDTFRKNKSFFKIFLFDYILVIFFSFFSPLSHESLDYSFAASVVFNGLIFYNIKILFLILVTYRINHDKEYLFYDFIKYNNYALILYIITTLIFVFCPNLKIFWRSIIYESSTSINRLEIEKYITRFGLAGYSGFVLTFRCTLFSIVNLIIIGIKNKIGICCYKNYILIIIFLIGNLCYGRVGLMFTVISIALFSMYEVVVQKKYNLLTFIVISFIGLYVILNILRMNSSMFDMWYTWAMAPIESFLKSGKIGTSASDQMFERMSFWPEWNTLLFGDGYYTGSDGHFYKHTDLGYMRLMLYFGVFVQLLAYGLPMIIMIAIYRKGFCWRILAFFITFQMMFFELKGEVFYCILSFGLGILISLSVTDNYKLLGRDRCYLCKKLP